MAGRSIRQRFSSAWSRALADLHDFVWLPPIAAVMALAALGLSVRRRKVRDIHIYGVLFIVGIAFFLLRKWLGDGMGFVSDLIAIGGNATCGWSWLLTRALFRPPAAPPSRWPLALVIAQTLAGAVLQFSGDTSAPLAHMVTNALVLISSTVLLLSVAEPLRGFHRDLPVGEQRFRLIFAVAQAALIATSIIWVGDPPAGSLEARMGGVVRVACATVALLGAGLAIWYRSRAPMTEPSRVRRRAASVGEGDLGERILGLMANEAVYTVADLRVADLARRVGEVEYKVTQCITGTLGFRNFNHMINHFRIELARQRLADPRLDHLPVLTIALDCGFGSIGPFNRAFKAYSEVTPTAYRDACRSRDKAATAGVGAAVSS